MFWSRDQSSIIINVIELSKPADLTVPSLWEKLGTEDVGLVTCVKQVTRLQQNQWPKKWSVFGILHLKALNCKTLSMKGTGIHIFVDKVNMYVH